VEWEGEAVLVKIWHAFLDTSMREVCLTGMKCCRWPRPVPQSAVQPANGTDGTVPGPRRLRLAWQLREDRECPLPASDRRAFCSCNRRARWIRKSAVVRRHSHHTASYADEADWIRVTALRENELGHRGSMLAVPTIMPRRYDALAFVDETHALHPLPIATEFDNEVPATYPTGV